MIVTHEDVEKKNGKFSAFEVALKTNHWMRIKIKVIKNNYFFLQLHLTRVITSFYFLKAERMNRKFFKPLKGQISYFDHPWH